MRTPLSYRWRNLWLVGALIGAVLLAAFVFTPKPGSNEPPADGSSSTLSY